jgi:hypothetical protein
MMACQDSLKTVDNMWSYCKTKKEDRVYIFLRQHKGTKQVYVYGT